MPYAFSCQEFLQDHNRNRSDSDEGIAFDGNRFNRTAATAPRFNYLAPSESADEKVVSQEGIEPSTTRRLRVQRAASSGVHRARFSQHV